MKHPYSKHIRVDEGGAVVVSFLYFFMILAAYYVVRPVREQLSAAVGSVQLPWFFAATFVAMLLLTPLFSWLVSSWPRRIVIPAVYLFFIVCQLLFVPLFIHQELLSPRALGMIFFVWVSVFNLFVVSVFWSFMADIWSDEQARRLFPVIALGGTAGAVAGPWVTHSLVQSLGLPSLLGISAFFLALAMLCSLYLGHWARKYGVHRLVPGSEAAVGGGIWDGLKQIFTNPFIRQTALLMVLGDAIGTIAYVLVTDYSGATFSDAIARTRFAASIDMTTNILQAVVQVTITQWLLVRTGAGPVIAVAAAISALTCLSMTVASNPSVPIVGAMPWVALMLIITRALAHGMVQPARETLYTLVPRSLRYKGKNAVDTVVWRAGDVASSLSINALRALGASVGGFGLIGAALLATSGAIGWRLAHRVEKGDYEHSP